MRFIVVEVREYKERWLIESEDAAAAMRLDGLVVDHDDGAGTDTGQMMDVEETADETEELP